MEASIRRVRAALVRLFTRRPVIYVHPSLMPSPAVRQRISELYFQVMVWKWQDSLKREVRRQSPLFNPRFGLVGAGPDAQIQVQP